MSMKVSVFHLLLLLLDTGLKMPKWSQECNDLYDLLRFISKKHEYEPNGNFSEFSHL